MKVPLRISRYALLAVTAVAVGACSQANSSSGAGAPPTPAMPAHWKVISDIDFAAADIQPVAQNLGAAVSALRNTTYDVGGKQIKLNTIVAATPSDADSIVAALGKMKPAEWFLRRGLLVYEFVGSNATIPDMREGRALLASP